MKHKLFSLSTIIIFIASSFLLAEGTEKSKNGVPAKTKGNQELRHFSKFNINNISTYVYNNGDDGSRPHGDSGFEYPKGSSTYIVYHSGLLWGAKKNDKIYVGGSSFSQGLLGGKILENGTPQDPNDPSTRVYRVRPDFKSADLSSEIADEKLSEIEVRSQYEKDWNEWPASFGAPYDDVDKNGIYNPTIDIPGVPGAHQTLWYVANDLDSNQAKDLYGSPTLGVELQVTVWGYKTYPQNNIMYKKYKLINKSDAEFTDMYISQWSDSDVASASDDFVGCDTLLNFGYTYNGDDYDYMIGSIIPAVGFQLMQGPIVKGEANDIATFNNHKISGYKNIPLTSFLRLLKNYNTTFDDPYLGDYNRGTLVVYNFMQGLDSKGNKTIDPITGKESTFMLTGNPVSGEGWIENSNVFSPGDRRLIMSSGPFNMAVGDTQEVIYAEIAGVGETRLKSVEILKNYADMNINSDIKLALPDFEQPTFNFAKWGATEEIELILTNKDEIYNFEKNGYKFQGLNLYLFDGDYNNNAQTIKITYDIIDGIKQISGQVGDNNKIYQTIMQTGNDTGIPKSISINKDLFTNTPLIPGKEYRFGLSAYYTNPNEQASVFESFIYLKHLEYLSNITKPQYGDTIFIASDNSQYSLDIKVSNPSLLTGSEYQIKFHQTNSNLSFDLLDLTSNKTIIENYSIFDFATNTYRVLNTEVDGFLFNLAPKNGLFTFNAGEGIEETYSNGTINNPAIPVWGFSNYYYQIKNPTGNYWYLDRLIKDIRLTVPFDYEIRFDLNENYGVQFFTSNKIISVPFSLWNIGIDTPNDTNDDIRMIPFIKEYEERNYWGVSDSTFLTNQWGNYYFDDFRSDQIFWMFPDKEAGGYAKFAEQCKTQGIGSVYDLASDTSPQGYFIDFKEDTSYAIGNMIFSFPHHYINYMEEADSLHPIHTGTIIKFTSTKSLDGETINFKTPFIKNPQIDFDFEIFQNYPNPFNPNTMIRYFIQEEGRVKISVYNVLGQKVAELINKNLKAGKYETEFNGSNLSSGVYIYRIEVDSPSNANIYSETKKMLLLK